MSHKPLKFLILSVAVIALIVYAKRSSIDRFVYNRNVGLTVEAISPYQFSEFMHEDPPPWMYNRIHKDLLRYASHPISRKKLDSTYLYLQDKLVARFQIYRGQLNAQTNCPEHVRFQSIKYGLEKIASLCPSLNVDFIVCLEDHLKGENLPVFVFAKHRDNSHQLLFPDFTCFANKTTSYAWTYSLMPKIRKATRKIAWKDKENLCYWRGATTGIDFSKHNYTASPRCKLCTLSEFYPEMLDAKFSDASSVPKTLKSRFIDQYAISSFVRPEKHLKYKYLICLDGNASSYPGLHWRLISNSVVFKPHTSSIQWYYEGLIPDYHYIALDKDLANLLPRLEWAKKNDEMAKQIAQNASEFAEENLSQKAIFQYLVLLLSEYQKHCRDNASDIELNIHENRVVFSY